MRNFMLAAMPCGVMSSEPDAPVTLTSTSSPLRIVKPTPVAATRMTFAPLAVVSCSKTKLPCNSSPAISSLTPVPATLM